MLTWILMHLCLFAALISITTMLQTQEVSKGNNVSLNCSASGPNNLTLTWKSSNMPLVPLGGNITITTLDLTGNGSSVSSTLTIHDVDFQDQGSYDCIVSSQYQSDEKTVATVTVFGKAYRYQSHDKLIGS